MRKKITSAYGMTISLALIFIFISFSSPIRDFISNYIFPISSGLHRISANLRGRSEQKKSLVEANSEIKKLRQLTVTLLVDQANLEKISKENLELKALVKYLEKARPAAIVAETVAYDPSTTRRLMIINKGGNQGVAKGSAVIASAGLLVGVIERAESETSLVRLLRDPHTKIGAAITKLNDSNGVIMPAEGGALSLRFLSENLTIAPGSVVVTSGLNDAIPPNLPIGTVNTTGKETDSPFQRAILDAFVRPEGLRFVAVIPQL